MFQTLLDDVPAVRGSSSRRRCRPVKVHADKGYDSAANRAYLRRRGITARIARRGIESSTRLGRHRWKVERAGTGIRVGGLRLCWWPARWSAGTGSGRRLGGDVTGRGHLRRLEEAARDARPQLLAVGELLVRRSTGLAAVVHPTGAREAVAAALDSTQCPGAG